MYVEISGRQSGKTTRLVDHASDELINNIGNRRHRIAVVSHSRQSGERIRHMIVERFLDKVNNMVHGDYRIIHGILVGDDGNILISLMDKIVVQRDMEQPRWGIRINKFYVDEFAFINNQNVHMNPPLQLNEDAYYCTSPNGYDEFTLRLLRHCLEVNVDVICYDMSEGLRYGLMNIEMVSEFDSWCETLGIYPREHPFAPTIEGERLNNELIPKGLKRHKF